MIIMFVPVVTRMGRMVTDGGLALLGVEDGRGTYSHQQSDKKTTINRWYQEGTL